MPTSHLYVDHIKAFNVRGTGQGASSNQLRGQSLLAQLSDALANGSKVSSLDMPIMTFFPNSAGVGQQAFSALSLSTATGSVGAVINGVTITVTASGGDTATASAIAVAIAASVDPLVQYIVSPSATRAGVTVNAGSIVVGDFIVVLGQKLTSYSGSVTNLPGFFDVSSASGNTIATNIANAVNNHPVLSQFTRAHTNGSNTVYFWLIKASATFPAGMTITNAVSSTAAYQSLTQFGTTTALVVFATTPGILGNQITLTATGTGVTVDATTTASGRMVGGIGQSFTPLTLAASDL